MINLRVSKYRGDTFMGDHRVYYPKIEGFIQKSCETRSWDWKNSQKWSFQRLWVPRLASSENCDFSRKKSWKNRKFQNFQNIRWASLLHPCAQKSMYSVSKPSKTHSKVSQEDCLSCSEVDKPTEKYFFFKKTKNVIFRKTCFFTFWISLRSIQLPSQLGAHSNSFATLKLSHW